MHKLLALLIVSSALAACNSDNGLTGPADLGAGTGGIGDDLTTATTIAGARLGKVTTMITVTAVVTAVLADGSSWYIEDAQGGPYSGIAVACDHAATSNPCPASISTPKLHDLVTVSGTIVSVNGKAELVPTAEQTLMTGAATPPAAPVSAADLIFTGQSKDLWGTVVRLALVTTVDDLAPAALHNPSCTGDAGTNGLCSGASCAPSYFGFEVIDGKGTKILVDNSFDTLVSSPECTATAGQTQIRFGGTFDLLQGILDLDPRNASSTPQVLMPVSTSDFVFHQ
jgi:hypothetical protein